MAILRARKLDEPQSFSVAVAKIILSDSLLYPLFASLYEDVIPSFDQWKAEGKKLYIYSSGSIPAQKLLFGFSEKGDLLHVRIYFVGAIGMGH